MSHKPGKKIKRSATDLNLNARKTTGGNKKKKWVLYTLEKMKEGESASSIRKYLNEHKEGSRSEEAINEIFSEVNSHLSNDQFTKSEELTAIHLKRYNNTINKLLATEELSQDDIDSEEEGGISYETWQRSRDKKIRAYYQAIETMVQKETLLQYHNKDFTVEVNIKENIEVNEKKEKWVNVDKLTFEEQLELYELIKLCKKDDNVLQSVTEAARKEDNVTEDIEHEIIEEVNIEQIKREELPPPVYISPVTNFDPTVLLRKKLKEMAAKEMTRAGAKLTEEENKHLKD